MDFQPENGSPHRSCCHQAPLRGCRGLWELGQYSFKASYQDETGMAFEDINSDGNGMLVVWITFILQWPIFMTAAWYLEQVLNSGIGIRRHWLFPFMWRRPRHAPSTASRCRRPLPPAHGHASHHSQQRTVAAGVCRNAPVCFANVAVCSALCQCGGWCAAR